jgi:hypothetical protein
MERYRHGHGMLLRGDAVALAHVGYSLVEQRAALAPTVRGRLRGDATALEALSREEQQLVLVLEDGTRLPIVLTERGVDGRTWHFTSNH